MVILPLTWGGAGGVGGEVARLSQRGPTGVEFSPPTFVLGQLQNGAWSGGGHGRGWCRGQEAGTGGGFLGPCPGAEPWLGPPLPELISK